MTYKNAVGVGKIRQGLYYLQSEKPCAKGVAMTGKSSQEGSNVTKEESKAKNEFTVWHQRLGHAPVSKMQHINRVKPYLSQHKNQVCLTCPMARMTRLTFPVSNSHASQVFDLLHTDN